MSFSESWILQTRKIDSPGSNGIGRKMDIQGARKRAGKRERRMEKEPKEHLVNSLEDKRDESDRNTPMMEIEELRKAIENLPDNDPTRCESKIRLLNQKVTALADTSVKETLLSELENVACRGLSRELKEKMEKNGLGPSGLVLVQKFLTNVPELAQYLYEKSAQVTDEDRLEVIKRRLGPDLEVLGGIKAKGVDITKEWVKNLCKKAPSLRSLARLPWNELKTCFNDKDDEENIAVAKQLKSEAENIGKDLAKQSADKKAEHEEKLKKVKEMMGQAKEMASKQFEKAKMELKEKLDEVIKTLELPPGLFRQETMSPEQLFQQLDEIVGKYSITVAAESYKSDLEVVAKASEGRALCGIYYSKYEPNVTAGMPILLLPTEVSIYNPKVSNEIKYLKFSEKGAAAKYVKSVESSSTNVGFHVGGFYDLFVAEAEGGGGYSEKSETVRSEKSTTTSASVVQSIKIAKKAFRIEREKMEMSFAAKQMAMYITNASAAGVHSNLEASKESARRFMQRYGSHVPAGVQTLGGLFFSIVDAESTSAQQTSALHEAATKELHAQISFGFLGGAFGIGGSATGEYHSSSGKSEAEQQQQGKNSYTFSVKGIGPSANSPESFQQLIPHNSTWAIIDRGLKEAYIPVWELVRDLGVEYEQAAKSLEQAWCEDEEDREKSWKKRQKVERERREKEKTKQMIREGLNRLKNMYLIEEPGKEYGFWPTGGRIILNLENMKHEDAFDVAIELIMVDPEHNICEITLCSGPVYTLKCWEAALDDTETPFEKGEGQHVLFYSETDFKWKTKVPQPYP